MASRRPAEWEWINTIGAEAIKTEANAFARSLRVGAALMLVKNNCPESEWQLALQSHCKIPDRTCRRWMQNVKNVFEFLGVEASPRALQVITDQIENDDHSRELLGAVNDAIKGKNGRQLLLELSARKPAPKALPEVADTTHDVHEAALARADVWLNKLEDHLRHLPAHIGIFERAQLDRANALLDAALTTINPAATIQR